MGREGRKMLSKSGSSGAGVSFSIGAVAKGVFLSFAVTLMVAVLLGLAVSLTQWEGIAAEAYWISYVSIALGAMLAARHSRQAGWLHGAVVGAVFFIVSAVFLQPEFEWAALAAGPSLAKALGCLASGLVGGVVGVNA